MEFNKLKEVIRNPSIYPDNPSSIKVIETHISIICLTGKYAYKFKKPVDYGFLNYKSLEKRKYYCEEEIRRNKSMGRYIYLDVVSLRKNNQNYSFSGKGEIIDYAVRMKEFPQEYIMCELLKNREITEFQINVLGDALAKYYKRSESSDHISSFGDFNHIKEDIDENFEQIYSKVGKVISKKRYDFIINASNEFLNKNKALFEKRRSQGFIREVHGDLHSGNIVFWKKLFLFDAIEFNERFKYMDVVSDFSFLLMDLDHYDYEGFAKKLLKRYVEKSGDIDSLKLVNFYKCYRSFVRGKVLSFIGKKAESEHYFNQSYSYSQLLEYRYPMFENKFMIIVSGLSGSGKTYCVSRLSNFFSVDHLNTDKIRKQFFHLEDNLSRHFNNSIYSNQNRNIVYEKMLERLNSILDYGSCIIDATFLDKRMRQRAYEIATNKAVHIILLNLKTSDYLIKKNLENRKKDKERLSDADWKVYLNQKHSFKGFDKEDMKYLIEVKSGVDGWVEEAYDKIMKRLWK